LKDAALLVDAVSPPGEVGGDQIGKVLLALGAGQENDGGVIDSWPQPLG